MKNKERIAILETEISRLKVANRNNTYRIEQIESHLAEQHKGANFSKLNPSEIPNTCLNIKPEAPECVANNGVSDSPIKPDFTPDWKDAPEDAVCVAMDKDGDWFWWRHKPTSDLNEKGHWNTMSVLNGAGVEYGLTETDWFADKATNTHLLPPDYWKSTLMMRPDAVKDYTHLLPEGYEFCSEADAEKWVKVEMFDAEGENELGFVVDGKQCCNKPHYRPIRPIQYKVTTHEIVTAVPDPYMPDWSKAPEGTVAHAWDGLSTYGLWHIKLAGCQAWTNEIMPSPFTLPADLDWKQSLRVKPN